MRNEHGDQVDLLGRPAFDRHGPDLPGPGREGSYGHEKPAFVVVYDEGAKGEEVESYYGFFSSVEQAKSQYAMMASGESKYHDAKVCRVVEVLPDLEEIAMEAENRWQSGRRDPESWRERGQEADGEAAWAAHMASMIAAPSDRDPVTGMPPTTLVEDGRIFVLSDTLLRRVDVTDEVRRSIVALTQAGPRSGAVDIVVRAAQDIANQFGWLDEPEGFEGRGQPDEGDLRFLDDLLIDEAYQDDEPASDEPESDDPAFDDEPSLSLPSVDLDREGLPEFNGELR